MIDQLLEELAEDECPGQPEMFVDQEPEPLVLEDTVEEKSASYSENPYNDAIKHYLREIQKTKLLSAEEERELAGRIVQGDKSARDKMIVSNLRLVVKIAKRYLNRGLPFLDLIEEGNLGLIKAVTKFKLSKECRFSTYSTRWVRQYISRALTNQSKTIRLPVHVSDDAKRMFRKTAELTQKLNRDPTTREVAAEMNLDVMYIRRLKVLSVKTFSIDRPMGDYQDYFLSETIVDTSTVSPHVILEDASEFEVISKGLNLLPERQKKIIILRFGLNDQEPQTLDAIGNIFGISSERIRQIEVKAMEKLRRFIIPDNCQTKNCYSQTRG
jgi:RNA polymerase primary sigma factor